jgi:hypothetical protein
LVVYHFDLNFQTLANLKSKIFGSETSGEPITNNNSNTKFNSDLFTKLLVAMAFTKLFVPVKLGLTALLTPRLARKLRYMGWDIGGKSMRTLGKEFKAEIKDKMRKE